MPCCLREAGQACPEPRQLLTSSENTYYPPAPRAGLKSHSLKLMRPPSKAHKLIVRRNGMDAQRHGSIGQTG